MNKPVNNFKKQPFWIKVIMLIYSICLSGAAWNHLSFLMEKGFIPNEKWLPAPLILDYFWTSLTFIDPLSVIVLFLNIHAGIFLILFIMIVDITVNIYATYNIWNLTIITNYMLLLQILFALFVLITGIAIFKYDKKRRRMR